VIARVQQAAKQEAEKEGHVVEGCRVKARRGSVKRKEKVTLRRSAQEGPFPPTVRPA